MSALEVEISTFSADTLDTLTISADSTVNFSSKIVCAEEVYAFFDGICQDLFWWLRKREDRRNLFWER